MLAVILFGCRKEQRYPGFTRVGGDGKISYYVDASTIRRATGAKQFSFVELIENSAAEYDVGEAMVDCGSLESVAGEAGHYDRLKHFISNTPQHTQSIAFIAHFVCAQGAKGPATTEPAPDTNVPAAVDVGGKWGYIDRTGKYVVNPQFDSADPFSEGLATVKLGSKWGYVDESGVSGAMERKTGLSGAW
jgi:hypothetical protein